MAKAIIHFEQAMRERGCSLTIRWTPAHKGVEGNGIADTYAARWAADGYTDRYKDYLREASLAHLSRKMTEARTQSTKDWIRRHVQAERRYCPPKGRKIRKDLRRESKESLVGISSPSRVTQQPVPTWPTQRRRYSPTSAGGATAASDRRAIAACSSNAGTGSPRSKSCGRASGRPASGNTRERQPSSCSFRMRERLRLFCSSCGIQWSEEWSLWRLGGTMRGGRD